jgi:hypothetical protein
MKKIKEIIHCDYEKCTTIFFDYINIHIEGGSVLTGFQCLKCKKDFCYLHIGKGLSAVIYNLADLPGNKELRDIRYTIFPLCISCEKLVIAALNRNDLYKLIKMVVSATEETEIIIDSDDEIAKIARNI